MLDPGSGARRHPLASPGTSTHKPSPGGGRAPGKQTAASGDGSCKLVLGAAGSLTLLPASKAGACAAHSTDGFDATMLSIPWAAAAPLSSGASASSTPMCPSLAALCAPAAICIRAAAAVVALAVKVAGAGGGGGVVAGVAAGMAGNSQICTIFASPPAASRLVSALRATVRTNRAVGERTLCTVRTRQSTTTCAKASELLSGMPTRPLPSDPEQYDTVAEDTSHVQTSTSPTPLTTKCRLSPHASRAWISLVSWAEHSGCSTSCHPGVEPECCPASLSRHRSPLSEVSTGGGDDDGRRQTRTSPSMVATTSTFTPFHIGAVTAQNARPVTAAEAWKELTRSPESIECTTARFAWPPAASKLPSSENWTASTVSSSQNSALSTAPSMKRLRDSLRSRLATARSIRARCHGRIDAGAAGGSGRPGRRPSVRRPSVRRAPTRLNRSTDGRMRVHGTENATRRAHGCDDA